MKKSFCICLGILLFISVQLTNAQKIRFNPFKPSSGFLAKNPSFLKDSTYLIPAEDEARVSNDEFSFKLGFQSSSSSPGVELLSNRYPLITIKSKQPLRSDLSYILNTSGFFDNFLEFNSFQMERTSPSKDQKEQYQKYHELYERVIAPIAKQNNLQYINGYLPLQYFKQNIYLNIAFARLYIPKETGDFPTLGHYTMVVLDAKFDTLGTYNQAVFGADHGKEAWKNADKLKAEYLAVALPNLLGQFLNDTKVQEKITGYLNTSYDEAYLKNKLFAYEYWQLEFKKMSMQLDLMVNCNMQAMAMQLEADNKETVTLTNLHDQFATATGQNQNTSASAIGAQAVSLISNITADIQAKRIEEKQGRAKIIINEYNAASTKQKQILSQLSNDSSLKMEKFDKPLTRSDLMKSISSSLDENALRATTALSSHTEFINNWANSQVEEASSKAASTTAETSAISNTSSSGATECQQQAKGEWQKSSEFVNYQRTATNANASDSKAKLIELTIQLCGNSLPANELQQLKQVAAKERATARQMRSETPAIKL